MHGSSPFRSTLNTSYITPLYMCEVCTVTSHVWTCVKYVPKQVRTCVKYVPKSILGFSASAGNSASRLRPGIRLLGFSASPGNSASRLRPGILLLGFSASPPLPRAPFTTALGFFPPNHPFVHRVFHYKPSILGYHYFWKHPYTA